MNARARLLRTLEARNLTHDPELVAELATLCAAPWHNEPVLWARLQRGAAVLDRRGDIAAPDHLWARWEALLVAWQCCQQEIDDTLTKGRRRRTRAMKQWLTDRVNEQ